MRALGLPPAEERLVLGREFSAADFCVAVLAARGAVHLQRAVGHPEPSGRALQIALLFIDHNPFGQLAGDAFNLLERRPDAIARRITL